MITLCDMAIDLKPYTRMIGERPGAQKVVADRKAAQAAYTKKP